MDSYESRFSMKLLASMMRFWQVYVNMCTFPYQYVYVYMYIQIYTYLEICIYHIYIYTTVHTFILGVYISRLHLHISNLEDILLRQSIQDGTTNPSHVTPTSLHGPSWLSGPGGCAEQLTNLNQVRADS